MDLGETNFDILVFASVSLQLVVLPFSHIGNWHSATVLLSLWEKIPNLSFYFSLPPPGMLLSEASSGIGLFFCLALKDTKSPQTSYDHLILVRGLSSTVSRYVFLTC